MSSNKSEHFQLHLWNPQDDFLREEFNENFNKLDGAAQVVVGTYTGDGADSQIIALGFQPKAVLVIRADGKINSGYDMYGGLAIWGSPALYQSGNTYPIVTVVPEGFTVYAKSVSTSYYVGSNIKNSLFHYLAFY